MPEVNVNIFDHTYRLAVSTGEEQIIGQSAQTVDALMHKIRDTGKVMNQDQAAVLAALELAYENTKARTQHDEDIQKLNARIEELEKALKEGAENGAAAPVPADHSQLQKDIDSLTEMCQKAIFADMSKGSLF